MAQAGYFTTTQAADAGYSTHLLRKHILAGRLTRPQRRIYRLVHFPAGEDEALVAAWLWTERQGVVSHQTALALHGISDVMPARIHLTLPTAARHRRLRVPAGVIVHHADIGPDERMWHGPVPITTASRTLSDCAHAGLAPDLLRQAAWDAIHRGLVTRRDIIDVELSLQALGGLGG